MTDMEKMDAFMEGFNEGQAVTKPLTKEDIAKMSKGEINANWDAVKEVLRGGAG